MFIIAYLQLGIRGIFLDPTVFRQQRESPEGLKRGFWLVLIIGLLVGGATAIGQLLEKLVRYRQEDVIRTIHDGMTRMPWYVNLSDMPGFAEAFEQQFTQWVRISELIGSESLIGALLIPVQYLLIWVIFGFFAHTVARRMGGQGSLAQTLACLSLASGANILAVIKIIPFAQVSATTLLALIISYLAIREAHRLRPWGAFWATMLGPLLLVGVGGIALVMGGIALVMGVGV